MAQQSHVPKFGNWDRDNIPYTVYFENARKKKGSGVKMNPNDPEENPEAFMVGGGGGTSYGSSAAVQAPINIGPGTLVQSEKHVERYKQRGRHLRKLSDNRTSPGSKSKTSESGSEKGNSDHSLLHPNNNRKRSDQKNSTIEANEKFSPSYNPPNRQRSGACPSHSSTHKSAAVPKFGAWDETNPKTGEGFTFIFNKVKEEKQMAAAGLPQVASQPSNHPANQRKDTKSKICCCQFWNRSN